MYAALFYFLTAVVSATKLEVDWTIDDFGILNVISKNGTLLFTDPKPRIPNVRLGGWNISKISTFEVDSGCDYTLQFQATDWGISAGVFAKISADGQVIATSTESERWVANSTIPVVSCDPRLWRRFPKSFPQVDGVDVRSVWVGNCTTGPERVRVDSYYEFNITVSIPNVHDSEDDVAENKTTSTVEVLEPEDETIFGDVLSTSAASSVRHFGHLFSVALVFLVLV